MVRSRVFLSAVVAALVVAVAGCQETGVYPNSGYVEPFYAGGYYGAPYYGGGYYGGGYSGGYGWRGGVIGAPAITMAAFIVAAIMATTAAIMVRFPATLGQSGAGGSRPRPVGA